jgi:hypothetical protein
MIIATSKKLSSIRTLNSTFYGVIMLKGKQISLKVFIYWEISVAFAVAGTKNLFGITHQEVELLGI